MSIQLKVLTYNIRHGKGTDRIISLKRIADVLRKSGAQLIGLQEVDRNMPRSNFIFQAQYLAYLLGMNYVFSPASKWFRVFEFGNAILSKYPIIKYNNVLLPGQGEQRALLEAVLSVNNQKIKFFNTHLGLSNTARELQVNKIIELLGNLCLPTILAGDFNVLPSDPVIIKLAQFFGYCDNSSAANTKTFPSNAPSVKIDYIFLSPHWKLLSLKTLSSEASDHLPLLGEVELIASYPKLIIKCPNQIV
ncbi:endonuclease/exonuclease/phosphatase family protein [Desulfolucanica intricata]|uniref:endonuclease/exonuclease/phosphatase family protein n=1 Tax=Desulfolucanica intricata TaxID=1285191 RepID=UPI000834AAC8|nr:endonuclease/exonuclease/phosphatase family protein [Desulfolucanica intricata]